MCSTISAENRLEHSREAISVTAQFYNKEVMVYVEGPDDVPFWDAMFSKVVSQSFYEITPVNGKEQLIPYIEGIENGTINNALVATDLDYALFTKKGRSTSSYIIYTYGHSIENTMFCPRNVSTYIRRASKKANPFSDEVNGWFESIVASARPLLAMDIINSIDVDCKYHKSNGSNAILGRGFFYYQDSNEKTRIASEKIDKEVACHADFDGVILSKIEEELDGICKSRDIRFLFQGHFLAEAIMNFIRITLKENDQKQSLSNDAFYNSFCDCLVPCQPLCHDKQHVCSYIEKAVSEYRRNVSVQKWSKDI